MSYKKKRLNKDACRIVFFKKIIIWSLIVQEKKTIFKSSAEQKKNINPCVRG